MKENLYSKLIEYSEQGRLAMHMPGHKRTGASMVNPYEIDITEIDGFDNLHNPEGIIKEEQERLAKIYGSEQAYILVNGSTCGNLAAMYAVLSRGDKVVIPKGAHKSVYNAVEVTGAEPLFFEDIFEKNIKEGFKKSVDVSGIKAVVVTSPDYNGYVLDIEAIAKVVHDAGAVLIVDSAHGAHLGFSKYFPENPIKQGADAVIMSLHKTLPALTQTSALLINGNRIDRFRLEHAIDIFETSSPSYVLMSSASICMDFLEEQGVTGFDEYAKRLRDFYDKSKRLSRLEIIDFPTDKKDPSKIIISGKKSRIPGFLIAKMLREDYKIEPEMTSKFEVLALSSVVDDEKVLDTLLDAIFDMDKILSCYDDREFEIAYVACIKQFEQKVGKISKNMITIYPPGSPILMPGDIVTDDKARKIADAVAYKLDVTGLSATGDLIVK